MTNTLCLASTSPRRRDLLNTLGIRFRAVPPRYDERPGGRPPAEECLIFAEEKARSVAPGCPDRWILAADTLIESDGAIFGKPTDPKDAVRILGQLSGKTHQVHTAVVLLDTESGDLKRHLETARVTFRRVSDLEIRDYVATGEAMGKAGAYAVQGRARQVLVKNVEGDEEAVIGLPIAPVKNWLRQIGLISDSEASSLPKNSR